MAFQERIADDDEARFEGYGMELAEQKKRAASGKPIGRALHVKQHLGLVG